ncbi:MAG: hypothetical protein H6813_00195 [Phycisphaeraceae bacterium]|nr:hypothetical protein [Phycisphaeraceae bacterium]MCB9847494.1 hypothetical protein [Phycisphaeraceae bacterium]
MAKSGKPLRKILGAISCLLVLAVVVVVAIVFVAIDSIARVAIEEGGSYATGVTTKVDSADVRVFGGSFEMRGFEIDNPEGFKSPHFLGMADTRVALSLGSLASDTVRLPELTLAGIDVYLEGTGSGANYNQILKNLKRFESEDQPKPGSGKGQKKAGSGKSFVIDTVTIDGVQVNVAGIPGVAQTVGDVTIDVPKIELHGVGSQGGMSLAEVVNLIVKTVLSATIEAGGGIIPADVLNDLGGQLAQLESLGDLGITAVGDVGDIAGQIGEEAAKAVGDVAEGAGKALDDAAKDVTKGIGDLLGGGDKKKKDSGKGG